MVKRLLIGLLAALLAFPALAQIPGGSQLQIDRTPITGGTTGRCLYDNAGKVGEQACGSGTAANVTVGTTTVTSGTNSYILFNNAGVLGNEATVPGANGGTGVANTGKTITLGGNLTTSGAFASTFTMTGVTGVTFPTTGTLATLTDLNNAIAGVNPAVAVQAATTVAGDTSGLTYNNGVAGIGASFTGVVNTALTVDGYTFTAVGQRLLVKNDTQSPSGAFNGVYYVTQIQTAILPIILTRALDYNAPSDINNTGPIPAINGTANGGSSWLLTSSVVTVGTDPLTFTQFTYPLASTVTLTGSQTLTNKTLTAPIVTSTTWASVPAPGNAGKIVRVSNFGTKGALLMDDGTRWKPVGGCATLYTLDTASGGIGNTNTIVAQYQIPAGAFQNKDRLRVYQTMTKSGTTDTGAMNIYFGTTGTIQVGDLVVANSPTLGAAQQSSGYLYDFRRESATSLLKIGATSAGSAMGYSANSASALAAAATVSDMDANAMWLSFAILSNGASNTVSMTDLQLQLCSTAN